MGVESKQLGEKQNHSFLLLRKLCSERSGVTLLKNRFDAGEKP